MNNEILRETQWDHLSEYLNKRSKEICADNGCTKEEHFCKSNAYITEEGLLVDICNSCYFQGWDSEMAVISLPWEGTGEELKNEVLDDIFMY